MSTSFNRRVGKWSAIAIVAFDSGYVAIGAIWLARTPGALAQLKLEPDDPYLAILELLILLSAPAMVALFSAIHASAPQDRRSCSLAALGFVILLAGLTGVVHFLQLTVSRQTNGAGAPGMYDVHPGGALSAMLAVDLLGWDFFLGFGLLFAAPVFGGDKLQQAVRAGFIVSGSLCLVGTLGPLLGQMHIQVLAIIGYAFVLPVVCFMLAIFFSRPDKAIGQS